MIWNREVEIDIVVMREYGLGKWICKGSRGGKIGYGHIGDAKDKGHTKWVVNVYIQVSGGRKLRNELR